jgi:hypothetical protein
VHYRTLDVPERFDCHVALLSTDYFSATDRTVNIGVQDRRFLIGGVEGQGYEAELGQARCIQAGGLLLHTTRRMTDDDSGARADASIIGGVEMASDFNPALLNFASDRIGLLQLQMGRAARSMRPCQEATRLFAPLFEDGVAAEPAGAGSAKAITTV